MKCEARVAAEWEKVLSDLRVFMKDMDGNEDTGPFHEYGLAFDYVAPGTFGEDQKRGYWRFQLALAGRVTRFASGERSATTAPTSTRPSTGSSTGSTAHVSTSHTHPA